jgi:hypothetical protein
MPPSEAEERAANAALLALARSGWLPAAIRESRRLERRARWARLLRDLRTRPKAAPGARGFTI